MAEAVFRSITAANPQVSRVDSAGTGAYHTGDAPDPRTMTTLEDNGIVEYSHGARKIESADLAAFDYVLAMDRENLRNLQWLRQRLVKSGKNAGKGNIMLFGDFGGVKGEEVVDPYYGAQNGFEIAYEQMVRFSNGFVEQVLGEKSMASS